MTDGIDNIFNFQKQLFYAVDKNFPFIFEIIVYDRSCDAAVIRDFLEGRVCKTFVHKNSQRAVQYFFTPFIMFNYNRHNFLLLGDKRRFNVAYRINICRFNGRYYIIISHHIDKKTRELRRC